MIIKSRTQLRRWIQSDFRSYKMTHPVISRFTYGENWSLFSYMKNLRYLEYYMNKPKKYPWDKLMQGWHWLKHRRNCKRMGIHIFPNTVGPGFHLQHYGYRLIVDGAEIGGNCEMLPMVLIGKKHPGVKDSKVLIGENCYIGTGVTILGPVSIGDNVIIGAGAVVNRDIPNNSVVAGIPAKIIKNL